MNNIIPTHLNSVLKNTLRLLAAIVALSWGLIAVHATEVTGWTQALGNATMSNTSTSSPTWGDGTTDNAKGSAIDAAFSLITLSHIGDTVTLTGTAAMYGITSGAGVFRFGLFNANGSTGTNNWLGYFVGNAAGTGSLNAFMDALNPSNSLFTSTSSVINLGTTPSTGSTSLTTSDNPVIYDFTFTVELTATNTLSISTSLFRPSDSAEFAGFSDIQDTSPTTRAFDEVGLQATGGLAADQIQLSDVDVTFSTASAIPEPATYAMILSALCGLGVVAYRRIRA